MNLINVGYKSVNCYALESGEEYLLIDVGMPATFGELVSVLKRKSVPLEKIRFLVVTHFHPDHCGIAQELKNAGVTLLLGDVQERLLAEANRALAKFPGYLPISDIGNAVVATDHRAARKAFPAHGPAFDLEAQSHDPAVLRGAAAAMRSSFRLRKPRADPGRREAEGRERAQRASAECVNAGPPSPQASVPSF
jgi:hypothetical protein